MSALTILLLTCDGTDDGEVCTADYGGDADIASFDALREVAAADGWQAAADGTDYCPDHQPPG